MSTADPCARDTLMRYARDTWASMAAMADQDSGLPADVIEFGGAVGAHTSITDIGAYMWSTLAAERIGLIGRADMVARIGRTLATLSEMDRHSPSGQFYNWYDCRTGARTTDWPPGRGSRMPTLSSVDNGWLAAGLHVVAVMAPVRQSYQL